MLRAIRGLQDGPPREEARRDWAIGAALTLLFFAILGSAVVSVRELADVARAPADTTHRSAEPEQHLILVPIPRPAPAPTTVLPIPTPTGAPNRVDRPGVPNAVPGAPIAPPASRQSDTSATSTTGRRPTADVESPRLVFPTQPCDLACQVRRREAAASDGGIPGSLTAVQRDSVRRELARRVVDAPRQPSEANAANDRPSTGAPTEQHGVSIPVGLPGGGPTAAQRKRNRELDADVSARLARIKARADSLARDSAAAAAKRKP